MDCTEQLAAVQAGIVGKVISREQWQPDVSSALCTFPFCTTIFASTSSYFSLAPRRHHCRKCGKLFCASHSTSRALMYDETNRLSQQRVCDRRFRPYPYPGRIYPLPHLDEVWHV
jgi:hypothetical protein